MLYLNDTSQGTGIEMLTISRHKYQNAALSDAELMARAPSIFATQPYEKMSQRYTFIPTVAVIDRMRSEGFQPFQVMQSRTRIPGKQEFTKHLIRFRDTRNGGLEITQNSSPSYFYRAPRASGLSPLVNRGFPLSEYYLKLNLPS